MRRPVGLIVALLLGFLAPASAQQPVVPFSQNIQGKINAPVQWTPVLLNSITSTVVSIVSSQPAKLAFIYCYNPTGAAAYLQLFDVATAAAVTVGTTTPVLSLGIPTAQASGLGPAEIGIQFAHGIQAASTTTVTGSSSATMQCNVAFSS